jgi:phage-related protein, HI1409 family
MNDGSIIPTLDGLSNIITGLGTNRDRRSYNRFTITSMNDYLEMEAAYYDNWIAAAVIDNPVEDATREWRTFSGKYAADIQSAEKRYEVMERTQDAFTWAGVYGGAGLLLVTDQDFGSELELNKIKKGSLKRLVYLDRTMISPSAYNHTNPTAENYMRAETYRINGGTQNVHHSHFILAPGSPLPPRLRMLNNGWDDSILRRCMEDLKDSVAAKSGVASLIQEANVDVISRQNLGTDLTAGDMDQEITNRFINFGMLKSMFRLALLDANEQYDRKQISFGGLGEILSVLMEWTSGAAKQPMTRLFGVQSKGLGDSGEGDTRNYYNRIRGDQEKKYRKFLNRIDEVLIRSTLGEIPDDLNYEFNPLDIPTESEVKDRNLAEAQTDDLRLQQKVIPRSAVVRKLKESGQYAIDDEFLKQVEEDERAENAGEYRFDLREAEKEDPGAGNTSPTDTAGDD